MVKIFKFLELGLWKPKILYLLSVCHKCRYLFFGGEINMTNSIEFIAAIIGLILALGTFITVVGWISQWDDVLDSAKNGDLEPATDLLEKMVRDIAPDTPEEAITQVIVDSALTNGGNLNE